ncbi:transposase [Mesorhizobium sp. LNHC252B00]|nr:transposase [Mesorhizobium sp. LNHC252B00]
MKGQKQLPKLLAGAKFQDGIEIIEMKPQSAA